MTNEEMHINREKTNAHLFSHSSTTLSGRREPTESIRPSMKFSGHSSSNNCPTTRGAFLGLTYMQKYDVRISHLGLA